MIYVFFWEHQLRQKLVRTWKDAFTEKWDQNNIFHIKNVYDHDRAFYGQTLLWEWLFSQKILCIIDDADFFVETKNELAREYADFFLYIFSRIGTDVTLVFNQSQIDQRSKFFKDAKIFLTLKDFRFTEKWSIQQHLQQRYADSLAPGFLPKLIEKVWEDFSLLSSEIEKLLLTRSSLTTADIQYISASREQSIFEIIDALLAEQRLLFVQKLRTLAYDTWNPYYLYSMLLANLRPYAYIFLLGMQGKTSFEIQNMLNLGKRAFLAGKKYKIPPKKFLNIYTTLVGIDTKMKSGNMLGSDTNDMLYEIETALFIFHDTHAWIS